MKNFILGTFTAMSLCTAAPSYAQGGICAPYDEFRQKLHDDYGETLKMQSILPNEELMQVFVNPETKSMTIITVNKQGIACYMVHGVNTVFKKEGTDI